MAVINGINDSSQATSLGVLTGAGGNEAGQDMFFKLLITQLQHQDPLNPMDSTDFTAQLAQFSQLEKLDSMNNALDYMQLYLASLNNAQAVDFIGKKIEANSNAIELGAEGSTDINYRIGEEANSVTMDIYDMNMRLVRTLELGSKNAGAQSESWDGTDSNGSRLESGIYTFAVTATDADGNPLPATNYIEGVVDSVTFEGGVTYLMVGGRKIAVGDVIKVLDGDLAEESEPPSGGERAMEIVREVGTFLKKAAPLAMAIM
jgi:flagellar basal-body rod modification protein FlgD